MKNATIRLFKALPIESKRKKKPSKDILKKTIKRGFVLSPEVIFNYPNQNEIIKLVEKEYGITPEQLNNSFHKSWEKIKSASDEQLFLEQILHYITTYGFENIGIYNEDSIYIPNEELDIPEVKDVKLVVIKGYTKEELKSKLLKLLSSGIALKEETMEDIIEVVNFVGMDKDDLELIQNREVKIMLYDRLKVIPENPTEFLRYLVYKSTEETLLIKNNQLIEKIKEGNSAHTLLKRYEKEYGLKKLSKIFNRFKPLFLAFKNSKTSSQINRISKLSKKFHEPMNMDYLNSITELIKNDNKIENKVLKNELSKVNTFRKIRLAYALNFRTTNADSILYKVRNGKGYAKEFNFKNKSEAKRVFGIVIKSIVEDIKVNVNKKKIFMPEHMNYTLPATEKQFTGNIPTGSYISVSKNMIVGVHWNNVDTNMIDLDLSMQDADKKIGWDSEYRTDQRDILFSGDITSAPGPNGATELFYIKKQVINPYIVNLNYYNYDEDIEVPFDIIVAQEETKNLKQNYMVDPNNLLVSVKSKIKVKQKTIGLLVPTTNGSRFYFSETGLGNSITSSGKDYVEYARKYMFNYYNHSIELKDILEKAGAKIVKDKKKCDIDLSPEALEKDTILNLLTK